MPSRPPTHRAAGWKPFDQREAERKAAVDRQRRNDASRAMYRTTQWQALRKAQLAMHPLCQCDDCQEGMKRVTAATVVDHRRPHKGDPALFYDPANLRSMAKRCHDRKTAREDGGFGNRRKEVEPSSTGR